MHNEWFEDWFDSKYYHLLYQNRSHLEADIFVKNCIDFLQPKKDETLLDLACGKGRHSVAFAKYGLDVTGVDLSKESIDFALQYESNNLHFYVHDMRNIFRSNYFDYICNLFTSFGYFKNQHDNRLAAEAISTALKPKGKLLIDFVNKNFALRNIAEHPYEAKEAGGVHFTIERNFCDEKFVKKIHVQDAGVKTTFMESVNSFTLEEMQKLFSGAGLRFVNVFGNYNFENYDEENSSRMILIFEK